jgi:hypothetical protein
MLLPLPLCTPCSAPHIIQSQLQEVLGAVIYSDFPEQWPTLLDSIMGHLTSNVSKGSAQHSTAQHSTAQHSTAPQQQQTTAHQPAC